MGFSKHTLNKSPTEKLIYQMSKHLNINPFNKKINNKLSKTTNTFCNKILKPDDWEERFAPEPTIHRKLNRQIQHAFQRQKNNQAKTS